MIYYVAYKNNYTSKNFVYELETGFIFTFLISL